MMAAAGLEAPVEAPPARRPVRCSRGQRAPRRPAVRGRAPARQPVPHPRLLQCAEASGAAPPAGHVGAARTAVPGLRGRHRRGAVVHDAAGAGLAAGIRWPGADAAPGAAGGRGRRRAPHVPARRRARPGQDRPGPARRAGGRRLPAAGRRPQRREDQLGARGRALDPEPHRDRDPRRRPRGRRLRRHRGGQLRGARPARRLARRPRLPRDGGRRGALHQEPRLAAVPARPAARRPGPHPDRPAADDGAHRHAPDQRHRGLPRDLAVPRLDRREEAARRADGGAGGDRADPGRPRLLLQCPAGGDRAGHRPPAQGGRGRRHPRPSDRRPAGRARRRGRPLDPAGRAGAGPPAGGPLPQRPRDPHRRRRRRRHRPRPGPPGRDLGAGGHDDHEVRGERLRA